MADQVDKASEDMLLENEAHLKIALRAAASIPAGEPGLCIECGHSSLRLVKKLCAPCRDGV